MIIENHNPDWQDIQVLLNNLFNPEEKRMVKEKGREENKKQNARDDPRQFIPTQETNWNPNTNEGRLMVKQYQQLILHVIKYGISRPKNLIKLYQVLQGKTEDPSIFYERLCEVA